MNEPVNLRGALGAFAGEWAGRNQLWFEPGTPVHECETTASLVLVARGAGAAIRYAWEHAGQPQDGLLLVRNAAEVGAEDMVWIDSFHTGGQLMRLPGEVDAGGRVAALGRYSVPGSPEWGWRIVVGSDGPDELHLLMYNIAPDGAVYPAVEARYARRHG